MQKLTCTLGRYTGWLEYGFYFNGLVTISFVNEQGLIDKLTINLSKSDYEPDEVFINANHDLGEGIDLVKELTDLGIIQEVIGFTRSGFVDYPKVRLTQKALGLIINFVNHGH